MLLIFLTITMVQQCMKVKNINMQHFIFCNFSSMSHHCWVIFRTGPRAIHVLFWGQDGAHECHVDDLCGYHSHNTTKSQGIKLNAAHCDPRKTERPSSSCLVTRLFTLVGSQSSMATMCQPIMNCATSLRSHQSVTGEKTICPKAACRQSGPLMKCCS